jgi:hypothetical protein
LRGDLESLRHSGFGGVSHTSRRGGLYVEESVLSRLSRYGTHHKRQPYRALHELERRQTSRRGAALTPPYVVDVEVLGMSEETRR